MPYTYSTRSRTRAVGTPKPRVSRRIGANDHSKSGKYPVSGVSDTDVETISLVSRMSTSNRPIRPPQPPIKQSLSANTRHTSHSALVRNNIDDTPAIPTVYQPIIGLVCNKYSGPDPNITIEEWLRMFSLLTIDVNDDKEKLKVFARHLSGEALSWMAEEIEPNWHTMTWNRCRDLMISRFSRKSTNPLVEAIHRQLNQNEFVIDYYNDMRRLTQQAGLNDINAVALLTDGMPDSYRHILGASRLKTPQDWYEVAINIESAKIKRKHSRHNTGRNQDDSYTESSSESSSPEDYTICVQVIPHIDSHINTINDANECKQPIRSTPKLESTTETCRPIETTTIPNIVMATDSVTFGQEIADTTDKYIDNTVFVETTPNTLQDRRMLSINHEMLSNSQYLSDIKSFVTTDNRRNDMSFTPSNRLVTNRHQSQQQHRSHRIMNRFSTTPINPSADGYVSSVHRPSIWPYKLANIHPIRPHRIDAGLRGRGIVDQMSTVMHFNRH